MSDAGRAKVFPKGEDDTAFLKLVRETHQRVPIRLAGYGPMPNHSHPVVWPYNDGDLSRWRPWLLTSHGRHDHSSGHVWQGRFKAFPIESNGHLLTVLRYVEGNPVRAKGIPIRKAQRWPWSSVGVSGDTQP